MKIARTLISATAVLVLFVSTTAPAFAYRDATPPVATTTLRQRSQLRELYADAFSSILVLAKMQRSTPTTDISGRSMLARSQIRASQRNFRRHVLGWLRGVDYRVLNVSGDHQRRGLDIATRGVFPPSLVVTGGSRSNHGSWGWDRITRRDIRDGNLYGVSARNRNVLQERAQSLL